MPCFRFTSLNDAKFVNRIDSFKVLSKYKFTISEVSPLYGIRFDQTDFEKEEEELRYWLLKHIPNVTIDIKRVEGLPYSAKSLMITVSTSNKDCYKALMITVSDENPSEEHLHLPFLCEVRSTKLGKIIHNLIGNIFKCNIKKLVLSNEDFSTIWGTLLFELIRRNNCSDLLLTYEIPQLPSSVRIECSLSKENVIDLWRGLQGVETTFLELDKVKEYWLGIEEHFYYSKGIVLSRAKITTFKMDMAEIISNEKVRVPSPEIIYTLFLLIRWLKTENGKMECF